MLSCLQRAACSVFCFSKGNERACCTPKPPVKTRTASAEDAVPNPSCMRRIAKFGALEAEAGLEQATEYRLACATLRCRFREAATIGDVKARLSHK